MHARRTATPGALTREVAAILSEAYDTSGLTQAKLGEMTGISQSQTSKYLRGERVLTLDRLDALCNALGLDLAVVVMHADARRR